MNRPCQQPWESDEDYQERIAPWETMTSAGGELKRARSALASSLGKLKTIQSREGGAWYCREVPASQRPRIAEWRECLERALACLDSVDIDAWKTELYGEDA